MAAKLGRDEGQYLVNAKSIQYCFGQVMAHFAYNHSDSALGLHVGQNLKHHTVNAASWRSCNFMKMLNICDLVNLEGCLKPGVEDQLLTLATLLPFVCALQKDSST